MADRVSQNHREPQIFLSLRGIDNDEQNIHDEEVIVLPLTTEGVIVGEIQPFEIPVEKSKDRTRRT